MGYWMRISLAAIIVATAIKDIRIIDSIDKF